VLVYYSPRRISGYVANAMTFKSTNNNASKFSLKYRLLLKPIIRKTIYEMIIVLIKLKHYFMEDFIIRLLVRKISLLRVTSSTYSILLIIFLYFLPYSTQSVEPIRSLKFQLFKYILKFVLQGVKLAKIEYLKRYQKKDLICLFGLVLFSTASNNLRWDTGVHQILPVKYFMSFIT
jgi:hypothetical protein